MKPPVLPAACLLAIFLLFISCSGNNKKDTPQIVAPAEDISTIPSIDIAGLKDEASVLDAMQTVVDARISDEKKQKENPEYAGNYLELTRLYTAVLNASTEFSRTITDPESRVSFLNKVSAIQDKMYVK